MGESQRQRFLNELKTVKKEQLTNQQLECICLEFAQKAFNTVKARGLVLKGFLDTTELENIATPFVSNPNFSKLYDSHFISKRTAKYINASSIPFGLTYIAHDLANVLVLISGDETVQQYKTYNPDTGYMLVVKEGQEFFVELHQITKN